MVVPVISALCSPTRWHNARSHTSSEREREVPCRMHVLAFAGSRPVTQQRVFPVSAPAACERASELRLPLNSFVGPEFFLFLGCSHPASYRSPPHPNTPPQGVVSDLKSSFRLQEKLPSVAKTTIEPFLGPRPCWGSGESSLTFIEYLLCTGP